jgi:hypothetical protein
MVGASATWTFAMISPTSHHGQWSEASFKISCEERRFPSQLAKDQKIKVSGSAPHFLYHREEPKGRSEPKHGIVHGVLDASAFFTVQGAQ